VSGKTAEFGEHRTATTAIYLDDFFSILVIADAMYQVGFNKLMNDLSLLAPRSPSFITNGGLLQELIDHDEIGLFLKLFMAVRWGPPPLPAKRACTTTKLHESGARRYNMIVS
jgi:hypothetical protein